MKNSPKIKLAIDLHRIGRYFPLEDDLEGGFNFKMIVDRQLYDEVAFLLKEYGTSDDQVIREFCFMLLWIEKETSPGDERHGATARFNSMWFELDALKQYLLGHRITSITLNGEYERDKAGEAFVIKEDINIDRICDGIRSAFREEFKNDMQKRRNKGLRNWKIRKMVRIRNNILHYFTSIPSLDLLSLDEQNHLVDKLSEMAGIRALI